MRFASAAKGRLFAVDCDVMSSDAAPEHLLEIIKAQNEIASGGLDLASVMDLVVRRAQELTNAGAAVIEMVEGPEMVYTVAAGSAREHLGTRVPGEGSLSGLCVRTGQVLSCDNTDNDDRVDARACQTVGAGSMIVVPLAHGDAIPGVLKVYSPAIYHFRSTDVETLRLLSGLVAAHMAQSGDYQAEALSSRTDPLTGLGNRRAYDEALAAEVPRARRNDGSLALCIFDLDDFSAFNDDLGQEAGDELLRGVAGILRQKRLSDAAFRLGDDQFAMILPETDEEGARAAGTRIAARIAALGTPQRRITSCFGVAAGEPGAVEMHDHAVQALRASKAKAKAAPAVPAS